MSSTPTVTVTLSKASATLPSQNAAYQNTLITLTDAAGVVQTASVNGTESPVWTAAFQNVAAGNGTVSAQDQDVNNAPIGAAVQQTFDETGSPPPVTFSQTIAISVTIGAPAASSAASAAKA